jgi:hypothetical protein
MFQARFNGPPGQNILIKQRGNNARLWGIRPMPQKFNPSAGDSMFSNARMMYSRVSGTAPTSKESTYASKETTYDACNNDQSGYIHDQSGYIQRRKMNAIGKGTMVNTNPLSFRSNDANTVNSRLRRCRSGGCAAPAKKGANTSFKSGGGSTLSGTGNSVTRV